MVDEKLIGYKMTREYSLGTWMFLGVTPREVTDALREELFLDEDLSLEERDTITITPYEISQEEIDNMPEFPGW